MRTLREKAVSGLLWSFTQQFGTQITVFFISILLTRLLEPSEFGLIGMIAILMSIGNALVDNGMGSSLLRTTNPSQVDYSTVFYTNLIASLFVYLLVFICAPWVSLFYEQPSLTLIIRVYSLSFIIASFSIVQSTKLNKEMRFKTQMLINIPSLVVGGIVGILLAYKGYGVWSLVFMNIFMSIVSTLMLWLVSGWRPQFVFDKERFTHHFNFGYKLTLSSLINSIFNNSYHIIIGKFFPPAQLGFYTRANSLKQLPVDNITSAISKVSYPLLASIQDDSEKMRRVYGKMITQILFWLTPLLLTAVIIAEPLFRVLLTEKWLPAVPYFQVLCFVGIIFPWHNTNLNILKVIGRSSLFLKLEMVYNVLILCSLLLIFPFGIMGLVWGQVVAIVISLVINVFFSGRLIGYNLAKQLKDILPILILSIVCGLAGLGIYQFLIRCETSDFFQIMLVSIGTFIIYLSFAWFAKLEMLLELSRTLFKKKS